MSGSETRVENESNKLFRKVVAEPDNFDGNRRKFHNWWKDMQLWLMGYSDLADMPKIIAVLTRLTAGDTAEWARAKKTSLLDGATSDMGNIQEVELVERFDDPSPNDMRPQNDIHQCFQDRMSAQAYIDKFRSPPNRQAPSRIARPYSYSRRGIQSGYVPGNLQTPTLRRFPRPIQDSLQWLETLAGTWRKEKESLAGARSLPIGSPPSRPAPRHSALDRRTGTGLTYGGSGQPMEIGQTRPVKCYNWVTKRVHMARDNARNPKEKKGLASTVLNKATKQRIA